MFHGKIECKCVCSIHHFFLEMVALNLISGFMFYHIFHNFIFFSLGMTRLHWNITPYSSHPPSESSCLHAQGVIFLGLFPPFPLLFQQKEFWDPYLCIRYLIILKTAGPLKDGLDIRAVCKNRKSKKSCLGSKELTESRSSLSLIFSFLEDNNTTYFTKL